MRVNLTDEACAALKALHSRFKKENPYAEASAGPFICKLIQALDKELKVEQITCLAPHIISERLRLKLKQERLAQLGPEIDDKTLERLIKQIKKEKIRAEKTFEKLEKSAESE